MQGKTVKIKEAKGFSIVELVVVIGIIAVAASMASVSWQRYTHNSNLRMAARQVAGDITKTKSKAVAKMDTIFTMTFTTDSYTTYPENIQSTTVITRQLTEFGQGITFTSVPTGGTLTFLTRGTVNPSSGTLILTNIRGSRAEITFNQTGKTYVKFNMQ